MKAPTAKTSNAFCELVESAMSSQTITGAELAKIAHIALRTVASIRNKELPNFTEASPKQIGSWVRSVAQVCNVLSLDLVPCLEACGLPVAQRYIQEGIKKLGVSNISGVAFSKEDLEALLKLSEELNAPLPLSFALEYLRLRKKPE